MTDQEIDLLSTAIAQKIAAVLNALCLPRAPSIFEPNAATPMPRKRGWPKGKKRKP